MPDPLRVAYTLEQCWHTVPGGTAVAAVRVAEQLAGRDDVELIGVAGRHLRPPTAAPPAGVPVRAVPVSRPWLYETWLRFGWPLVEAATGPVDVCHATALVPAASRAPLVVTVHDLAFVRHPDRFTRHGVRMMRRSLREIRRRADLVLCPSTATMDDLEGAGVDRDRLALVPLGADPVRVDATDVAELRRRHALPERFVLFVGTLEPRKGLPRLARAIGRLDEPVPLVVVGADGWGEVGAEIRAAGGTADIRFLGHLPDRELAAAYAAAAAFAYPSEWEGFGLPVLEAMAHGTPVVTSRGTSMAEIAAGHAVLVDPHDDDDVARGLVEALAPTGRDERIRAARDRAAELTWARTAEATVAAYREVAA